MNKKELSRRLKKLCKEETSVLANDIENGEELAKIHTRIQRIGAITRLLNLLGPSRLEWIRALIIGLLAIIVASALSLAKIQKNNIRITIDADSVNFRTMQWTSQEALPTKELRFSWIDSADSVGIGLEVKSNSNDGWLQLKGPSIILRDIELEENPMLYLYPDLNSLNIFVSEGAITAQVDFESGQIAGGDVPNRVVYSNNFKSLVVPETITIKAEGETAVPTHIRIRSEESWRLSGIKINDLSFSKERTSTPESGLFESSIRGGNIILVDIGKKIEVSERDNLVLREIESRRFEVGWNKQILKIDFEGSVKNLFLGPESLERDIRPSVLEYLYNREPIVIFWGGVAFLWSLLWSFRKIMITK